jgi:hypothetical protein
MRSLLYSSFMSLLAPVAFASTLLQPMEVALRPIQNELLVRDALERGIFVPRFPSDLVAFNDSTYLEKRADVTFSLEQNLENEVLFDGYASPHLHTIHAQLDLIF